ASRTCAESVTRSSAACAACSKNLAFPPLPEPRIVHRGESMPRTVPVGQIVAEALGTGLLVATVVGSGIMAQQLARGQVLLQLLCNALATVAVLGLLIALLAPESGAHF